VRSRYVHGLAGVLVVVLAAAVPSVSALAASSEPRIAPAIAGPATPVAATSKSVSVTLPTGERVRLVGKPGVETVFTMPAVSGEENGPIISRREGGHTYVLPAAAEPYLGRFLDKNLFDVTSLSATAGKGDRLPIRVAYRGSTPGVPGLALTAANDGVATGYLTPASSVTFGRALAAQWKADIAAGWPKRASLFSGLTKLTALGSIPQAVARSSAAKEVMRTLTIKTIAADGLPEPQGSVYLMNVDDSKKYNQSVQIVNGEARVSVPEGTYSLQGRNTVIDSVNTKVLFRIAAVNEFKVASAGQTVTLDYRAATVEPTATVPKATVTASRHFQWYRADAKKVAALNLGYDFDNHVRLLLAPTVAAKVGVLATVFSWELVEPVAVPTYSYQVAAIEKRLPALGQFTFADAQLATVNSAYYGEGKPRTAAFGRAPSFGNITTGAFQVRLPRGSRRTEYVGAVGGKALWWDSLLSNSDAWDKGSVNAPPRAYAAGTTTSLNWLKGPLSAAIPSQADGGSCFGCRRGQLIYVNLRPFVDSFPSHAGSIRLSARDGAPVNRFRFYRNGVLVKDIHDYHGLSVAVPQKKSTYKIIFAVDRRMTSPVQSIRTKTELTFTSTENVGKKLPSTWVCALGKACRVLPIVQARLSLPLGINGTLPAGKSTVTVSVAQVQNATRSPITSAGLEIRPVGGVWKTVKLTSIGGGKYQGVLNNAGLAGTQVDVRYRGADKAGGKAQSTVLRAYTVTE
jgi:hypothetical protein